MYLDLVSTPLKISFTVVYEDIEDGWVMARVLEMPGAISQGQTRAEARDNVRDALRELLLHQGGAGDDEQTWDVESEPLDVTIAP